MLIDDEPIALDVLEVMLSSLEGIQIVGTYTEPAKAIQNMKNLNVDVVFLDMEMGEMNGLQVAEIMMELQENLEVVFVTAYSQYAVEAFEVNAIDYLLKPVNKKRLYKTIERIREKQQTSIIQDWKEQEPYIRIKSMGSLQVYSHQDEQFIWRTRKAKELFVYLWKNQKKIAERMCIIEILFSDMVLEKASTLLHTTVYQLRKTLRELGYGNVLLYVNGSYQLEVPIKSDFQDLTQILKAGDYKEKEIEKILELYQGDFLADEGYQWIMGIQQEIKSLVLEVLRKFAIDELENNRMTVLLEKSLRKMSQIDPYDEKTAMLWIRFYGQSNQRDKLNQFYHEYTERLWEDLNIEPLAKMRQMVQVYMIK